MCAPRQEAEELVPLADEAGRDECCLHRRGPGQHRHRQACVERRAHDARTGIVDSGHACVGHEGDPLPRLQPRQQLGGARSFVVLVIREQARVDPMTLEQRARVSRVFTEHDVRGTQLGEDAKRHVLEIPDRRGADRERH